ncbi:MAG: Sec-independent protein translocase protein TatB [Helicobacteraceae bacterium]|nr:Sec-independent protein translocase protein TatB [Helicobacteraceae bacterium]
MLDFSFGEILVIVIIAVIFLGPDKLPQTFVNIAKFFKAVKKTINDAKETLDREIHISELKQEALEYKQKFENSANNIKESIAKDSNIKEISDILNSPLESQNLAQVTESNEPKENLTMEMIEKRGKKLASNLKPKVKDIDSADSTIKIDLVDENLDSKNESLKKAKVPRNTKTSKVESKKIAKIAESSKSTKKDSNVKESKLESKQTKENSKIKQNKTKSNKIVESSKDEAIYKTKVNKKQDVRETDPKATKATKDSKTKSASTKAKKQNKAKDNKTESIATPKTKSTKQKAESKIKATK